MDFNDTTFFFQAEDGIRDVAVTGVQTCALPISRAADAHRALEGRATTGKVLLRPNSYSATTPAKSSAARSEERRVGKECSNERTQSLRKRQFAQRGSSVACDHIAMGGHHA